MRACAVLGCENKHKAWNRCEEHLFKPPVCSRCGDLCGWFRWHMADGKPVCVDCRMSANDPVTVFVEEGKPPSDA